MIRVVALIAVLFISLAASQIGPGLMGPGPGVKGYAAASGPTYVNGGGDFSGGGSLTTGWSPTNGNTLIVWSYANDTTTTHTCSDGEGTGNTYTPDAAVTTTGIVGRIFHASNISGSGTYTITCTGTTPGVTAVEISGNRTLDTTSAGTNPSTASANGTPAPAAFTPTTAATILVNGLGSLTGNTVTFSQIDTNYTTRASGTNGASQFVGMIGTRVVSSSASYSGNITCTGCGAGDVAFNAAYK